MTMPIERMRALRWGYELLQEMGQDQSLPEVTRARAGALLVVYPVPEALARHVVEDRGGLPKTWADALSEALDLFEAVGFRGQSSAQTRRSLLFTRRHYPDHQHIRLMANVGSLKDWLAAEDCQGELSVPAGGMVGL